MSETRIVATTLSLGDTNRIVTLNGLDGDAYFIELKDGLTRDVGMNVPLAGSLHTLGLGAAGLSCNQSNFIPRAVQQGDESRLHQGRPKQLGYGISNRRMLLSRV